MSKTIKKQILLSFDEDAFLEFRRTLFQNGFSVQDFFANIVTLVNNQDDDYYLILNKARSIKKEKILTKKEEYVKEDILYEMFEEKFNK